MDYEQLNFDVAVTRAKRVFDERGDIQIVELELHPSGLWTMRYIKDDPQILYEVTLN